MIFRNILLVILTFILFPIITLISVLIFILEFKRPFYTSKRVGLHSKLFNFYKFRTMKPNKLIKFSSTSDNDIRITKFGKFLRKFKLDELPQILNLLKNEVNFIGPRANVKIEVDSYTNIEKKILDVKPGIIDPSSIVFSNEGQILKNSLNPDIDYNLLIRPRKNFLSLIYIKQKNFFTDIQVLIAFIILFINKKKSLKIIYSIYLKFGFKKEDILFINDNTNLKKIYDLENYYKRLNLYES
jgi:lipopolysaccharide/colanic/teichoic acid biosynthesis glycosyltransferase